jgi:tRNA(Ile)-lysidine synthetase-like protein
MSEVVAEILDQVQSALEQACHPTRKTIVVGLSGGIDSQVLAHALRQVCVDTGRELLAVHVDHGLRSESSSDANRVREICDAWGIPFVCSAVHVDEWDEVLKQGTESAARHARYAALANAAIEHKTDFIATGHTLDDQVETVLLRLLSGTGLEGLSGMSRVSCRSIPLKPGRSGDQHFAIIRPLLSTSRTQVEEYAREVGIQPIEDSTNKSITYRRNALRHNVVPHLDAIEPSMRESIARTTTLLQDDARFIADAVDQIFTELVAERGEVWMLERHRFSLEHKAIQRRVLLRILEPVLPANARIGLERIEALRKAAVDGKPGKLIEVADDVVAYVDYDRVAIGRSATLEDDLRRLSWVPLLTPGTEICIHGEIDVSLLNGWCLRGESGCERELVLRTRRDGDRTRDARGRKMKLQDWMVNHKVPRYLRDWLPVVALDEEIQWVIGLDMTELPDSRNDIHLQLEREL